MSLDGAALARWMASTAASPDGRVWSWHNPRHPGFDYPEAAAVWLLWASWRSVADDAVAERLAGRLARGAIGRDGRGYLFDTALGCVALVRAGRAVPDAAWDALEALVADGPTTDPPGDRWSERWGAHLLKAAGLLATLDDARARALAARATARVEPWDALDYCHALAYAGEGALLLSAAGLGGHDAGSVAAALAQAQRPDGAVPAFRHGGPARADATAQAARLWGALPGFEAHQAAALDWLATMQTAAGGLPYGENCDDVNTWATAFADQAGGADLGDWI